MYHVILIAASRFRAAGAYMICVDKRVLELGVVARRARGREGPVIVAASSVASWHWCPLRAWHDVTLFNAGWLSRREAAVYAEALAALWEAQLARGRRPAVRRGRLLHGDHWGEELEVLDACSVVELGVYGLIEPRAYREQVRRLEAARDPVEYFESQEWPLFVYRTAEYELAGVPDGVKRGSSGVIVYELKTTRNPEGFVKGKGLVAALHQLTAYVLAIGSRWRVEKAVLQVADQRGRLVKVYEYTPGDLGDIAESVKRIARELAGGSPPGKPRGAPCKTCEYNRAPPRCPGLSALVAQEEF